MLNILKEQIKDNHILILGYGREGHSTLHRILEVGGFASVTVADKNQVQLPDSRNSIPAASLHRWKYSLKLTVTGSSELREPRERARPPLFSIIF